jgi:hypothetical protein
MRARSLGWVFAAMLFAAAGVPFASAAPSDEEIKRFIIQESIASYPGNCPCPYNRAANGSKCGKRSAWSRAGGYSPICYPEEVTQQLIDEWRQQHGG